MMQINLALNVATVDFLCAINGKEIVLDSKMENEHIYLLIYPKKPIIVDAIDDMFNSDYDVIGFVEVGVTFNKTKPFKYDLGLQIGDSAPFVPSNDLLFDLINNALISNGIINESNQANIVFDADCFYGIKNTSAIITVNDDDLVRIENVDILDSSVGNQDNFIDWINNNYNSIIETLRNNSNTWQELLDYLKQSKAILCPTSAYELAQVKFEYDDTKKSLHQYQKEKLLNVPQSELKTLNQLVDGGIVMLNAIIEVDFNNGGNLGVFIESMAKDIPIDFDMVNITDNMIDIDFKKYN